MTRTSKPMRGNRPTKRLDLTDIRHALADGRQWAAIGVVVQPEDGAPHWEIVADNGDVIVEVELQPEQVPVTARLAAGMWIVPDVGDEVAVILPAGELDFMPIITCVLAHAVPTTQGPQPGRVVIVSGEVFVHDGTGGAVPLALKSDVDALATHVDGHSHSVAGVTAGAATVPSTPPLAASPIAAGTDVLRAK